MQASRIFDNNEKIVTTEGSYSTSTAVSTALEIQLAEQTDGSPANRAFACVCSVLVARTIERKDLKSRPGPGTCEAHAVEVSCVHCVCVSVV